MSKKGRPQQLRTEVLKSLKDERLTPRQRLEYILMLAELDGVEFKFKQAKTVEELPTEEDIFARNSEERIKAALGGVKGESHANASTNSEQSGS
jgi:hypothetical protein